MLDANVGERLVQAFKTHSAAHAYIVVGERPYLPQLLAQCAQVTMCAANTACGSCESCAKVIHKNHQDVISIPADTVKNRITVADVAYLVDETYKRPVDNSKNRVFLINAADSVSGVGCEIWQNKLLKTLEEPSNGVYIFIAVTDAENLLLTVRSRCQVLKQSKSSLDGVYQSLLNKGYAPVACQMVSAVSGGSVNAAERLISNPQVLSAYNLALDTAQNMTSTKNALTFASRIIAAKDNFTDFLQFYTLLLRESIVYRLAPALCRLPLLSQSIDVICGNYTLSAAQDCIERLAMAKKQLDNSANFNVTADCLLVDILQLRYLNREE